LLIIFFSSQGYRWLVENNLIQNTPEHMAAFLMDETGLSKSSIGKFLGEKYVV
jgi:cytohesin